MTITTEQLADLEAIKRLKARYFRSMDTKDWEGLAACFTEDLEADFRDAPGMHTHGRDVYLEQLVPILQDAVTVHHGHMPEIAFTGADEATGIWAMDDIVQMPGMHLRGWGHYHERYRREAGVWRICYIRLTRLHSEMSGTPPELPGAS